MPVYPIDTLKPKNNGSFPIVEAVDVSVSDSLRLPEALDAKANASDLAETAAVVNSKANQADVETATTNLQSQINEIITPVTQDAEVQNARVDSEGVSHVTLKDRLDSDVASIGFQIKVDFSWVEGQYVMESGVFVNHESWKRTDYIPINQNLMLPIKFDVYVFSNTYVGLYDENKNVIRTIQVSSSSTVEEVIGTITNYYGAKYIIFSCKRDRRGIVAYYYPDASLMSDCVGTSNIVDNAITQKKIAIIEHDKTTNFINYGTMLANKYIYDDDGTERSSADVYATDFIELEPNTTYYCENVFYRYYAFYDENKQFISSFSTLGNLGTQFTTPANAKYGRFTLQGVRYEDRSAWISKTNSPPSDFRYVFNIPVKPSIYDKSIGTDQIKTNAVTINEVDFVYHDPNTNYISGWVDNAYIKSGVETPYQGFYATEPVYLEENVQYYHRSLYAGYYAFYAEDGTVLEYHNINDPIPNPFTIPTGCKYARFTVIDNPSKQAAWISTVNTAPDPFRIILSPEINVANTDPLEVSNPCDYLGDDICTFTKCLCIGDSLTAGTLNHNDSGHTEYTGYDKYSYPRKLELLTGIEVTNLGHGGQTSGEWYNTEKNSDLSGYDMCIIQLGVNDEYRRRTLEMTTEEWFQDTSKCGFANIISKVKAENKNIKIFVADIPQGRSYHDQGMQEFSAYLLNWLETTYVEDQNVIPLDIQQYGHTLEKDAYNCGHLSAYGYYRLAKDYKAYISWYMTKHSSVFKEIQFIGTDYWYDDPNA